MVQTKKESSHYWWFDSHSKSTTNRSSWLLTTLAELDEKTKTMLQIIEEDADSFAQRAEMYYKKRPELITMVQEFYKTHKSLAERYDQVKTEPSTRLLSSPWSSPLPFTKYLLEKSPSFNQTAYDSYSEACGPDESDESEVDDPEEEGQVAESESEEGQNRDQQEELIRLKEEVRRLKEENEAQSEQLKEKDEEKREVIRQLSVAMELLREDNANLKERIAVKTPTKTPKKEGQVEYNKLKESFMGRLFNGFGKSPVIAL